MAGITPLNNFLGPESDPVTADTQLPKYQSTKRWGRLDIKGEKGFFGNPD